MSRLRIAFFSGVALVGAGLAASAQEQGCHQESDAESSIAPINSLEGCPPNFTDQEEELQPYPDTQEEFSVEVLTDQLSEYFCQRTGWFCKAEDVFEVKPIPEGDEEEASNEEVDQNQIYIGTGILSVGELVEIDEEEPEEPAPGLE